MMMSLFGQHHDYQQRHCCVTVSAMDGFGPYNALVTPLFSSSFKQDGAFSTAVGTGIDRLSVDFVRQSPPNIIARGSPSWRHHQSLHHGDIIRHGSTCQRSTTKR
jgi:hypothetical protein